jgi:Peptidase S46
MMKNKLSLLIVFIFISFQTFADEGMWLPQLLQTLNEKQMKKLGMKINASDIYNINKGSLKDAIVSLGGFCTAEVISNQGLILTNHHCGFDAVQNHSSLDHNYIRDGFWAYNKSQELQNQGLFVSFIISIDEVTNAIVKDINNNMTEKERQSVIDKNIAQLKKDYKKETYQDIIIRPFFEGNKYFLFVTETYKDVRLVGAPPASIGNFGKDTDNWMWPRHTGDFSMFRIYADKNNHPAEFSPENVPYVPKKSLTISLKGMKEGDFTMVFGFPGRTNEYLSAAAIKQIMTVNDPAKIKIRHEALDIMKSFMTKDESIKIQYAAKYASIENAYKKWQGEVLGLTKSNAIQKKLDYQAEFTSKLQTNPLWQTQYGKILDELSAAYKEIEPLSFARDYYNEIMPKIELFNVAAALNSHISNLGKDDAANVDKNKKINGKIDDIFNEYNAVLDQQLFEKLLTMYVNDQPKENTSPLLQELLSIKTIHEVANDIYTASVMTKADNIKSILAGDSKSVIDIIKNDNLFRLYSDINETYTNKIGIKISDIQLNINKLQRQYMEAQLTVFNDKVFYPDANSTLRVAYGNVKGYQPRDGMNYDYYTYMDGVMEKYKPGDYEFDLPKKLIDLYNAKDFGQYAAADGRQPVCFIAANHTTGGNSGSPALDANGYLVGLNFDRVWEGTMSDINYDPNICRNIMVDIRYVLFIIDKFAGASNLIEEMKIVKK